MVRCISACNRSMRFMSTGCGLTNLRAVGFLLLWWQTGPLKVEWVPEVGIAWHQIEKELSNLTLRVTGLNECS